MGFLSYVGFSKRRRVVMYSNILDLRAMATIKRVAFHKSFQGQQRREAVWGLPAFVMLVLSEPSSLFLVATLVQSPCKELPRITLRGQSGRLSIGC